MEDPKECLLVDNRVRETLDNSIPQTLDRSKATSHPRM
ncbi:hypothetical protein LEMLEM_LOCUS1267 [Lemmus lemmus]